MDPTTTDTPDAAAAQPPSPLAPPTAPGSLPAKRVIWPKVLGIVLIVLGVLGSLGYLWGVVGNLFFIDFAVTWSGEGMTEVDAVMREWAMPMGLLSVVQLALAALLLACGIGMVRRRPWSISAARAWAWGKIATVIVAAVFTMLMQRAQFEAMTQGQHAVPKALANVIIIVTGVFTVLWGWALPIFVLIWLRLRSSRAEVATWSVPVSGGGGGGGA